MAEKLTERRVRDAIHALRSSGRSFVVLWDGGQRGLGLHLRESGVHSWVFVSRPKGSGRAGTLRKITLGRLDMNDIVNSIRAARQDAAEYDRATARGLDPVMGRQRTRLGAMTVGELIENFRQDMIDNEVVRVKDITSSLTKYLSPLLGAKVSDVTQPQVADILEEMQKNGMPAAARALSGNVSRMFKRAVRLGVIANNPMSEYRLPRETRAQSLRKRTGRALSESEIKAIWITTAPPSNPAQGPNPFYGIVRMLLATGARKNEVAKMRWGDLLEDRIVIRPEHAKTGLEHHVPLTGLAREALAAFPRGGDNDLVFPSAARPGATVSGWCKLMPRLIAKAKVEPFTLHDCRRTVRTLFSALGVQKDVAEMCIGHTSTRSQLDVAYDLDARWGERMAAFERLSDHLLAAIHGDVVPLSSRRKTK